MRRAGILLGLLSAPALAQPVFDVPLACTPGRDCFVQNYVDHGGQDWHGGHRTYPGHDGTDLRLSDWQAAQRGFAVLVAAAGRVIALRDGEPDHPGGATWTPGRECGNGVVIDHGEGWQTQYCHMAQGSVTVHLGQQVTRGTPLGRVGQSGASEFPHVHLTIRHDGRAVDPFGPGRGLWSPAAASALAYRQTEIIAARMGVQQGHKLLAARIIGLMAGDVLHLSLTRPDGSVAAARDVPIARDLAQWTGFVAAPDVAPGASGTVVVLRNNVIAIRAEATMG